MSKKFPCPNGTEDDCGYPACAHATQCERAAQCPPDAPAGSARPVNVDCLAEHGHISAEDAQNLHGIMMRSHGITEPDEIVADWNRRDPEAPWGSGKIGKYVRELSQLCCDFMSAKIKDAGGPDVECDLGRNA